MAQATPQSALVGRWDAETRSRGGLGTWIELINEGACSQTTGAMVDGTWKIDGEQLTLSIPDETGKPILQRGTAAMQGNVQTQVLEGQRRQLTRRGTAVPRQPAIVGVWTYPHPAGGQAYEEYRQDGRFLFRLPIMSTSCRWTVDTDRIHLTVGGESRDMRWRIAGDRLTLDGPDGNQTFRRERAGMIPPAPGR
jgi:hypothetical protein